LVTLREIAEQAGVSVKTVSRVVNGDPAVAAKMRERVLPFIEALDYVPNSAARQMRGGASTILGLMTDAVATTPYSVDIIRGAQSALGISRQLMIASSDGDPQREADLWRMFQAHRVSGVVYAAMYHRAHLVTQTGFANPIILANCHAADGAQPSIIPDDEGGGYSQARYLLERGHRRIACVTLIPDLEATMLRARGMRRAFQEAGVAFDDARERRGMVGPVGREVMVAYQVARELLSAADRPTAVICGNDQVATQVYAAAASLGLTIPQDVSVMGFDDLKLISQTLCPALTTVALPYFEIGRRAVEMSLAKEKQLDGGVEEGGTQLLRLHCPLIERESCRPLA
jgi:LacI family transcriptional regulator